MEVDILTKNLVIVESPAKAKTIERILGKNYKVMASVGHVRDLPKSTLGINIEENYEPKYITIRGKGPIAAELRKEGKKADKIFLATDPDREGEAISWHLAHILKIGIDEKVRIEFNEITKDAVKRAISNPRRLDQDLIDAQQARRILDRLVGYKISPLLWKKIRKGLSAGRVQSVATKIICDREEEIKEFVPEEYWSIKAILSKDKEEFEAVFRGRYEDGKEKKLELNSEEEVNKVLNKLDKEDFKTLDVKKGSKRRNPYPPYTTSTLQQDSSRRLGFNTKKTMTIAQQLYEGINIKGEGITGLITYMRTDSTRISKEAIDGAREFIFSKYGKEYFNGGRTYGGKTQRDSQDAHEAIRPTSFLKEPEEIKSSLNKDQYRLYKLIWERFISSQMSPARYDTIRADILSNNYIFRASGSKLVFPGFLKVYSLVNQQEDKEIPRLKKDEKLDVKKIEPNQHFTRPPSRYTEASLIKTLEEMGIGRPSTYSPTIGTILSRNYVVLENRAFYPTELGSLVNDLLTEYFGNVINEKFTAELEEKLDDIAEGKFSWRSVVDKFYVDFNKYLLVAEKEIEEIEIEDEVTDEICEKCGKNMVIKTGRFGKFLACPGYPDCKNTKTILDRIGIDCPLCDGDVVRKRSRKGRLFYGCSNYPDCKFVSWDEPLSKKCPKCKSYMTIRRRKKGDIIRCSNKDCGYIEEGR